MQNLIIRRYSTTIADYYGYQNVYTKAEGIYRPNNYEIYVKRVIILLQIHSDR